MTPKIDRFLAERQPDTPCLVVDLDVISANFGALRSALPQAEIYYAVKANPASPVLQRLVELGSSFDAASLPEIERCLTAGADPSSIAFGNTAKKMGDIAGAHSRGVRLFAFDSEPELEKLAVAAPGSEVFCRLLVANQGAAWPLSGKFGCSAEMAVDLMIKARDMGLAARGISFHVGSQQTEPGAWQAAIGEVARIFTTLAEKGISLDVVNLGGGFPIRYRDDVPGLLAVSEAIRTAIARAFGNRPPGLMIEPGRILTANAGLIRAEVVLVSTKGYGEPVRWVYLDIGKFGGLAETMDEAIRYALRTEHPDTGTGPVVLAGPTCDGADILYEHAGYRLPMDLKAGDKIDILDAGAYTASYSSVGFNGFPPLREYYL